MLLTTIFGEHADFRRVTEFFFLLPIRFMEELALGWVGIQVNVIPTSCRLPRKELQLLHFWCLAGITQKVVPSKLRLRVRVSVPELGY